MTKKLTEAERMFYCYCDGFMRSLKLPTITTQEELHIEAKTYVHAVLKLNEEEQDDD